MDWPKESDDRDLERKVLQDVAQYLANSASLCHLDDGGSINE